ncbi:MAG TPA: hypothetical protein VM658_05015 [bacterium]|nr:hypothetical protein [bacterium]
MNTTSVNGALPAGGTGDLAEERGTIALLDATLRRRDTVFRQIEQHPEDVGLVARMAAVSALFVALFGASLGVGKSLGAVGAGAVGMPLLLAGAILVTFPLLYVFLVYYGSRMHFTQALGVVLVSILSGSIIMAGFVPVVLVFNAALSNKALITFLYLLILGNAGFHGLMAFFKGVMFLEGGKLSNLRFMILMAWSSIYFVVFICIAQLLGRSLGFLEHPLANVFRF